MPDSNTPLVITRASLQELQEIATKQQVPSDLSYVEAQQVMILTALVTWIKSYGITPQFEINLKD